MVLQKERGAFVLNSLTGKRSSFQFQKLTHFWFFLNGRKSVCEVTRCHQVAAIAALSYHPAGSFLHFYVASVALSMAFNSITLFTREWCCDRYRDNRSNNG